MTLLFEYAARAFDPGEARHVRAEEGGLDPDAVGEGDDSASHAADDSAPHVSADSEESVPVDSLVSLLANRERFLAHPDEDWLCVPLHEADGPALTDEFVAYEDHPVRGPVFIYRDADGDPEPIPAGDFADTPLGRRIRFWLSGRAPGELPDYADPPTDRESAIDPVDPDDFFDRLEAFVEAEREADRDRNRERAATHTPKRRSREGDSAIPEIGGFSRTDEARFRFHVIEENSGGDVEDRYGIFEGNDVLIHSNDPDSAPDALPVEATVDRIAGFTIDLVARSDDPDAAAEALDAADSLGLSILLNDLPSGREADGVAAARSDDETRDLLTGQRDATFIHEAARRAEPQDADLNRRQELAATRALYADDAFCIHGPPGTGKTRTLVEVVRRAVAAGERVLVTADSNQAVDNALVGSTAEGHPDEMSLHYHAEVEDEFTLARHRADHSDREFVTEEYRHTPPNADVVATTNNSAAQLDPDFDLVVVDEATQATIQSTLIPAAKGDRLVLAGDHQQLPPFDARTLPDEGGRHRSLFEHLYADDGVFGHRVGTMLTTQYRMVDDIARFPDREFYDGELRDGRAVEPIDGLPSLVRVDASGSERTDDTHSYRNSTEVEAVESLVARLLDAGVHPEEVGVITPYEAQVEAIRDAIDREVEVDTIDSFQGGEREAVVISFVRSNDRGEVGFLGREQDGPRRLNVALTRAERFLGLVGDWETLRDGENGNECADLYRSLYDYLDERGESVGDANSVAEALD